MKAIDLSKLLKKQVVENLDCGPSHTCGGGR